MHGHGDELLDVVRANEAGGVVDPQEVVELVIGGGVAPAFDGLVVRVE